METIDALYVAACDTLILTVLYLTNVLPEYIRLFKVKNLIKFLEIDEFFVSQKTNPLNNTLYMDYLCTKYYDNLFLARLFSCVYCSNFWLSLILSIFVFGVNFYVYMPMVYVLSLFAYFRLK